MPGATIDSDTRKPVKWCHMASITLKNVPEGLLRRLRARARHERRSVAKQVIVMLEAALDPGRPAAPDAADQVAAWRALAGKWVSSKTASEEIAEIDAARTRGRKVDL